MSDNEKSGSGQPQSGTKTGPALTANIGKLKDKSHEFSFNPEAPQVAPPTNPQDTKNINKDKK